MHPRRQSGPSVLLASCALPEKRNVLAELDKLHPVADLRPLAIDPSRQPAAAFKLDNRELIRHVIHVRFRRRKDYRLGVNRSRSWTGHAAPKIVITLVAPDPPRFCASPTELRLTCRSPASPRICCTTSQIWPTPVAPTGS